MIYIAHRGLLKGPSKIRENHPSAIDQAIKVCAHVEIDLRVVDGDLVLGHDEPQYKIDYDWLKDRYKHLWIHCKNISALEYMQMCAFPFHHFWHENDTITLTSKGYVWAFPGKQPIINSIAVLPEKHNEKINMCLGICTDYVLKYQDMK